MSTVITILMAMALLANAAVSCVHALHMFQQNRYELPRYSEWLLTQKKRVLHKILFPAVFLVAALFLMMILEQTSVPYAAYILLVILAGCSAAVLWKKEMRTKYIKPLVYTGRVKRQIALLTVLNILWVMLVLWKSSIITAWIGMILCYIMPWILIYPMAWITEPIENAVKKHYQKLAADILQDRPDLIRIGITGSYGKTSTKNIMQSVVSVRYQSLMTPASYNTPMGITRTIREMLKPIDRVFICEMGADHVNDIAELMDFVKPSIGIVTSIGPQHLNTFGSLQNIIDEKMKMIEMLPNDGTGIINIDNEYIRDYKIQNPVHIITYGIHAQNADYRADQISYTAEGSTFHIRHEGEDIPMQTRLLGELNILNILSAAAAARHLDIPWTDIQKAVREMKYVEHRLEMKKINGYTFIDDAFNANPQGSAMALEVLKGMPGRRFIVTPGMIDLGEKQDEINHSFGMKMKGCADEVILVGQQQTLPIDRGLKDSGFDRKHVHIVATEKEAFALVYRTAAREDTILLENDLPDAFNQ